MKTTYKENPKTKGSGIICGIPQTGTCPNKCGDCFFQSGRSYLEPLDDNLPNMPSIEEVGPQILRVNDGNDSNVKRSKVIEATTKYPHKFFNTAIPKDLGSFPGPVVLTVNPGDMTDKSFHRVDPIPTNLMFVRCRSNTWNIDLQKWVIDYYAARNIPVVLTWMAYFNWILPDDYKSDYIFRKRTTNEYWAITTDAWHRMMDSWRGYQHEKWVYSCGKIEGEQGSTACRFCGNCMREYFATIVRTERSGLTALSCFYCGGDHETRLCVNAKCTDHIFKEV